MTLVLVVAGLAVLAVCAVGRSRDLASVRVRAVRLLVVAIVVQVGTAVLVPDSGVARGAGLILGLVLVSLFLAGNARLPGVPLIAAGLLLNVAVIGLIAAMPVSLTAAARAGVSRADLHLAADPTREAAGPQTRLRRLGDTVPVALPVRPQVVSPGDILVAAGVGLLLVTAGAAREVPSRTQVVPKRADRSTVLASDATTRGSYS